jgi:hypothetical protein
LRGAYAEVIVTTSVGHWHVKKVVTS